MDIPAPSQSNASGRLLVMTGGHELRLRAMLSDAGLMMERVHPGTIMTAQSAPLLIDLSDQPGTMTERALGLVGDAARHGIGVIVVGSGDMGLVDRFIEAGATHVLTPRFDDDELRRTVRLAGRVSTRSRTVGRQVATLNRAPGDPVDEIARALAQVPRLALLHIGLTRFEMINVAFGRAAGDALLIAAGQRIAALAAARNEGARALRISGAEFWMLLPGDSAEAGEAIAAELIARLGRPFLIDGHLVRVGCCVGLAGPLPDDDAPALIRRASGALAAARARGNHVRAFSAADERMTMFDAGLDADLRNALDGDQIELLFQPQVSVTTGAIVGVEALARWRHPAHGELGADTLFEVATRSNYLAALSAHIQQLAAKAATAWPTVLSQLRLSINLTAADIARPGFVEGFFEMIDASGFPRGRLTVEITESELIENLEGAALLLASLRAGGCRVAIDDFGTGYSSLAYLKALPLDYLKIDKQLAQDITGSARDRVVVRGVIDMARSLGLAVIAEGVETEEQLTLLAREGCQYYQGFLFAEPLSAGALVELMANTNR